MANSKSAAATNIDKKPIHSLPAVSGLSVNQINSGSLQPPKIGPVKGAEDSENSGYIKLVKEQLQLVTPAKGPQVSDREAAVAHGIEKASEIEDNNRYSLNFYTHIS